jgi:hypothetical protein
MYSYKFLLLLLNIYNIPFALVRLSQAIAKKTFNNVSYFNKLIVLNSKSILLYLYIYNFQKALKLQRINCKWRQSRMRHPWL